METDNRKTSRGNFVASLVFFGLCSVTAFVLLLTALIVWLAALTNSVIASTLIVGGFFAVLSIVTYHLTIKDALEQIREQVETIYDVARLAKTGYEWIAEKFFLFLKLRGK